MEVQDHVFVVTGGGNGIGREVVLGLLERGAHVAAVDLRPESLAETAVLAGPGARRMSSHTADISDAAAVATLADEVLAAHGHVDGLLNVAGIIQRFAPFAELGREDIEKVLAVNLWGVINTTSAFLPHLTARPAAALVNVSSMGALVPVPGQTVYGASKAAVKLLTEGLYAELRESAVAVTLVLPGGVSTDIAGNSGASIPGLGEDAEAVTSLTTPADAGRQVIEGLERGRYRVLIGKDVRLLDRLSRLMPRRTTELVAKRMAALLD